MGRKAQDWVKSGVVERYVCARARARVLQRVATPVEETEDGQTEIEEDNAYAGLVPDGDWDALWAGLAERGWR